MRVASTYADEFIPAAATPTVQWNHPLLGEVVTALVQAGLRYQLLRELPETCFASGR